MNSKAHPTARHLNVFFTTFAWLMVMTICPSDAVAQWGGAVRGQMGFGGDKLASVQYSDGSESDLKLGTYFSFTAGPVVEVWASGPNALELQGMVGWSGWSTGPENTDDRLKLNRFPVELLAFYGYRIPSRDMMLRVGGGVTYHIGGGVSGSGSFDGLDIGIDNALGGTGEVAVVFGILAAGLRYTHMSNTVEGTPASLDASSVGLFLGLTTPRN